MCVFLNNYLFLKKEILLFFRKFTYTCNSFGSYPNTGLPFLLLLTTPILVSLNHQFDKCWNHLRRKFLARFLLDQIHLGDCLQRRVLIGRKCRQDQAIVDGTISWINSSGLFKNTSYTIKLEMDGLFRC